MGSDMISEITDIEERCTEYMKDSAFRKKYLKTRGDQEFINYGGLQVLAHPFIKSLEAKVDQYPSEDNGWVVICHARLETSGGRVFVDIGDATPDNVGSQVKRHAIRVAATRAKVRVLRDMLGIDMVGYEELEGSDSSDSDIDEDIDDEVDTTDSVAEPATAAPKPAKESVAPIKPGKPTAGASRKAPAPTPAQGTQTKANLVCSECGESITSAVASFSMKRYGRELCMSCQQKVGGKKASA